jgi:hypothetical protein
MLVTGNRDQNGTVASHIEFFSLKENEHKIVPVQINSQESKDEPLCKIDEAVIAEEGLTEYSNKDKVVLIWLEQGTEPTNHLLNNLMSLNQEFIDLEAEIVFLCVEGMENLKTDDRVIAITAENKVISGNRGISICPDIQLNVGSFPHVILLNNNNEIIYHSSGYNIGTAEQLVKLILKNEE